MSSLVKGAQNRCLSQRAPETSCFAVSRRLYQARYWGRKKRRVTWQPLRGPKSKKEVAQKWSLEVLARNPQLQKFLLSKDKDLKERLRFYRPKDVKEWERLPYLPPLKNDFDRIPEASALFFNKFLLSDFNAANDSESLYKVLQTSLEQFKSEDSSNTETSDEMRKYLHRFEFVMRRHIFHTCLGRLVHAPENQVNGGTVDVGMLQRVYGEMDAALKTHLTLTLQMDGLCEARRALADGSAQESLGSVSDTSDELRLLDAAIDDLWRQLSEFMCAKSIVKIETHLENNRYHQSVIGENSLNWAQVCGRYMRHLCESLDDAIAAVAAFEFATGYGIVLCEESALALLCAVARHSPAQSGADETQRLFRIYLLNRASAPSRAFFNGYLAAIASLGDFNASIDVLRLLLFGFNFDYKVPNAPRPDEETFANCLAAVRYTCENRSVKHRMQFAEASRKTSWVLTRMSQHRLGAKDGLLLGLYETLGVSFWDHLRWKMRPNFIPKSQVEKQLIEVAEAIQKEHIIKLGSDELKAAAQLRLKESDSNQNMDPPLIIHKPTKPPVEMLPV